VVPATGPDGALRAALSLAAPTSPVLLTYKNLAPVQDLLTGLGAIPG
jgi:hypothetical protein